MNRSPLAYPGLPVAAVGDTLLATGTLDNATDQFLATSSVTLVDVDATNLKVTGTVPTNGKLKILLQGTAHATASQRVYVGLRDAAAIVAAAPKRMLALSSNLANPYFEITYYLTGLTPGAAFDYRFAYAATAASGRLEYGGQYGPLYIRALTLF